MSNEELYAKTGFSEKQIKFLENNPDLLSALIDRELSNREKLDISD